MPVIACLPDLFFVNVNTTKIMLLDFQQQSIECKNRFFCIFGTCFRHFCIHLYYDVIRCPGKEVIVYRSLC